MSEPTRVVVSQHCSVRMPVMTRWPMPRRRSQRSSPVSENALCVCFSNTTSGEPGNQSSGVTKSDSLERGGLADMENVDNRNAVLARTAFQPQDRLLESRQ